MSDKLFSNVVIEYTMIDAKNPRLILERVVEHVIDINVCIHQTAKSARMLGMKINEFTVKVEYE